MNPPRALVLCVPNFSEGRDEGTILALMRAITGVEAVRLLDRHTDPDHHRTVLTFVGAPRAVMEAAFRATRVACRRVDLRVHQGEHPRIGAADVIPFVPLRGVSMDACVQLATRLGRRIGRELGIPVFLYERAASRVERSRLETIRRGGIEGLRRRMATDPAWRPDFGPSRLHPSAGATVVGARPPLIAFNVNLASRDLGVARAIARRIRASSGGFPSVKAIGVRLGRRGMVQVSTNLTCFEETPPDVVFAAIKRAAERVGVGVASSEIVGVVPAAALAGAAARFLQLDGFRRDQILEVRGLPTPVQAGPSTDAARKRARTGARLVRARTSITKRRKV